MKIICIGDVVGGVGRRAISRWLPGLIKENTPDLVIANGENAAGGIGLTVDTAKDLLQAGVDVITSGNHIWRYKELTSYLDQQPALLRPLNYPEGAPGRGAGLFEARDGTRVGVLNLQGRVFMDPVDCPFRAGEAAVDRLRQQTPVVVVDFHAEATSEKRAMGWHLDGKASAIFGTHTHVQTADEEVLPGGTGYITDAGMTGPFTSVIGTRVKPVLRRFLSQRPASFSVAKKDVRLCGVLFTLDPGSGRCQAAQRIRVDEGIAAPS